MIRLGSKQELIEKHKFLIGLTPIHFEVADSTKTFVMVRFSNGEVGVVFNTIDFCQQCLNKPIRKIEINIHPFLNEWVVIATFDEERWLNIVTGISGDVKIWDDNIK